jgi:hypothetical protein
MEQVLIIIGAAIFGILGIVHLSYTLFTNKFAAYDPDVTKAMMSTSPILTKETTVWDAWIGFNVSHSLGAILVAAVYIPIAINNLTVIEESLWFTLLPVVFGLCYMALAKYYWFKIPFVGISISTICFVIAAILLRS